MLATHRCLVKPVLRYQPLNDPKGLNDRFTLDIYEGKGKALDRSVFASGYTFSVYLSEWPLEPVPLGNLKERKTHRLKFSCTIIAVGASKGRESPFF